MLVDCRARETQNQQADFGGSCGDDRIGKEEEEAPPQADDSSVVYSPFWDPGISQN